MVGVTTMAEQPDADTGTPGTPRVRPSRRVRHRLLRLVLLLVLCAYGLTWALQWLGRH